MPGCSLGALPSAYDGSTYEANTVSERELRTRFKAFLQPMKDAEMDLTVKPTSDQLAQLLAAGSPSVRSITSGYYAGLVDGFLKDFAAAAGQSWTPAAPPMGAGGKFGSWIFSARGTDLRQIIEKGLFAAAFYNEGLRLLGGAITPATLDRLIALYGAHPSFPRDTQAPANPDELSAAYAKRRDKGDLQNPGPYLKIKAALIRAQAALRIGESCAAERDRALSEMRGEWERALLATTIYYLSDAMKKLGAQNPMPQDQAAALHGYGEAIGFIHGFRNLPAQGRVITDAQIDELLTLLLAPAGAPATSYKLITDTAAELPRLGLSITKVAAIYGFTPQQIEDFKTNY